MYNRYVRQTDGSYRRSRVPEPDRRQAAPNPGPPPSSPSHPPEKPPCPPEKPPCPPPEPPKAPPCPPEFSRKGEPRQERPSGRQSGTNVTGFLRQLLPKNFDTGDLLVVLLLLLVAGDCAEDRSNALLTLALYLFM